VSNSSNNSQALYRFFDNNNNLLYIGISKAFVNRLNAHSFTAEWFFRASYVTIEHFETRQQVESAEKHAIKSELPKYNKAHNPNYESHLVHWRKLKNGLADLDNKDDHRMLFSLMSEYLQHLKYADSVIYSLREIDKYWGGIECELCRQISTNRQYARVSDKEFQSFYNSFREEA